MSAQHTKSAVSYDGAGSCSSTDYNLEFRCMTDNAWYTVRTVFNGKMLTVKYQGFDEADDDLFEPRRFVNLAQLEEFRSRFRPVSHQLQDSECRKLTRGMAVCVSHSFNGNDNLFYDAAIDDVVRKKHSFVNGEERCMCRFFVAWTHGPAKGQLHTKHIENICVVQSDSEPDPALARFLELVRQQNEESSGDDLDVGGPYAVLIENLEKGISPATIEQFIKEQISVLVEVHALGSLSYGTSMKAFITVDSENKYHRLCNFLDSPAHFVTSWTGRPLVVTDKSFGCGPYLIPRRSNLPQVC
ncbi:hypothetical protein LINGRAHAP2_LOCUS35788 [Linum grandiflorum]